MTEWPSELSRDPLIRYNQIRSDPWVFLKHVVRTHDEVDKIEPVKQYPSHLSYLYFLTQMWIKHNKIAVPKSRRLTVSWTFIALALWDCLFHKGRSWALVSKKEEDSKELISRAEFIYNNIPEEIISKDLLPKIKNGRMSSSPPSLEFPEIYSKLMGFPSGPSQLRQRGFSGILEDECAFWDDAEAAYASAEPTTKGGGKLIMVSTRYPGFFKKIVYDKLDARDLNFSETPPVPSKSPMEGIDVWKNPRNEFHVIDLSHRANPAKRHPDFEKSIFNSLPIHLARMEYGKSWSNLEGRFVYEDFNERIHATQVQPKIEVGLPVLIGFDSSGLTPAVVIAQLQGDRLFVVKEIVQSGMGAARFVPHVAEQIKLYFPQIQDLSQTISFIDPAGLKRSETNERTYMQYIIEGGFKNVRPGPVTWEKRKGAVDSLLVGLIKGEPKITIYEPGCPILMAGFKGGYRYSDKITDNEPDKVRPLKDIHSHPHDALQYLCAGIKDYKRENYNYEIPTPTYGFQKTNDITPTTRKNYGRNVG